MSNGAVGIRTLYRSESSGRATKSPLLSDCAILDRRILTSSLQVITLNSYIHQEQNKRLCNSSYYRFIENNMYFSINIVMYCNDDCNNSLLTNW